MKFNGWQRIGVILSALWLVGAPIYMRMGQVQFASEQLSRSINNCLVSDIAECLEQAYKTHATLIAFDASTIPDFLFFALAPIFLGWLVGFIFVKTLLWIKAGFA